MSRGKECSSCRAYMKTAVKWKNWKEKNKQNIIVNHTAPLIGMCIFITFLLKYFSNFTRATVTHCSHWVGCLLSSFMTWNDPSRLSPACILYTDKHTQSKLFLLIKQLHCWGDFHQWKLHLCLTCSTTSAEEWVCQNELYMEGLWTKALSN